MLHGCHDCRPKPELLRGQAIPKFKIFVILNQCFSSAYWLAADSIDSPIFCDASETGPASNAGAKNQPMYYTEKADLSKIFHINMRKELFEFTLLLVTMIKMGNSRPPWLPTTVVFLCKILYPEQTNNTVTNPVADSFCYILCRFSESADNNYHLVIE